MPVNNINPGNKALEFIDFRVQAEKYRGAYSSQHNRYVMNQVINILNLLNKYTPNQGLMTIRTTDLSKRPQNIDDEALYAKFCNEAKEETKGITSKKGIGTQDAMRKNLFPDLHRMGLIIRYDEDKHPTDPFSRQNVKYVSLSSQGLKMIKAGNIKDRYFIFSKGIDNLLGGYIDILLDILRDKEYGIDNINIYEYMFFVSAIDSGTKFNIDADKAVELIKSFRNLTPVQRTAVVETLKSDLNPKKFSGAKPSKRDFHNWKNKIDQIYYLLDQTIYFEVRGGVQLVLKGGENSFTEVSTRLDRSLNEKYKYFIKHEVSKVIGFELHHIVPLSWSENIHHFKMLDKWENMVYIDGYSHAKISQNHNKNVILDTEKEDMRLSDYSGKIVYLKYKDNIIYKPTNQSEMKKYNNELLNTIK